MNRINLDSSKLMGYRMASTFKTDSAIGSKVGDKLPNMPDANKMLSSQLEGKIGQVKVG